MGNYMECVSNPNKKVHAVSNISSNKVKVVIPNGTVQEFQTPVLVAELMLEYPLYFVYSKPSSSNVTSKAAAMPADARLVLGQLYFLLPARAFHSGNQSPSSYGASFDKLNSNQNIVSEPENSKDTKLTSMEKSHQSSLSRSDDAGFINLQLQMAYQTNLIARNNPWKPRLETIGETGVYIQ
ncbi:hypothetical protein O6H91_01G097300 [Diphasiastrum complanatum]|uniref:Uncharacterized protein n=2 Tax=Diphasiastrum complanatum TaxID=34168 RepID=A0ACC2ETQ8_DIPCM|nr:hypothetical protein O6H91_01G096700 [Diphasiastrum complanatum]KAJ7569839.1 hypothetical protein O6H91_01G097300 [Diphasiastrum complanatum]